MKSIIEGMAVVCISVLLAFPFIVLFITFFVAVIEDLLTGKLFQ